MLHSPPARPSPGTAAPQPSEQLSPRWRRRRRPLPPPKSSCSKDRLLGFVSLGTAYILARGCYLYPGNGWQLLPRSQPPALSRALALGCCHNTLGPPCAKVRPQCPLAAAGEGMIPRPELVLLYSLNCNNKMTLTGGFGFFRGIWQTLLWCKWGCPPPQGRGMWVTAEGAAGTKTPAGSKPPGSSPPGFPGAERDPRTPLSPPKSPWVLNPHGCSQLRQREERQSSPSQGHPCPCPHPSWALQELQARPACPSGRCSSASSCGKEGGSWER